MELCVYREELERVASDSLRDSGADGLTKMLSNMMNVKSSGGGTTAISGAGISLGSVIPVNDIRGLEGMSYTKNEKLLRCKLAALYRIVDMYGWTQSIYNHISVICLPFCPNVIKKVKATFVFCRFASVKTLNIS